MSSHTAIKQVTKSNFTPSLIRELKSHIDCCDFISLSSIKTASATSASPWQRRLLPFDTAETAYLKAKLTAESFQLLNVSICPFRVEGSKVVAFPYNFHIFPREEVKMGLPSHSFSCQASYLESLAREGFDFNLCIYKGISYLSRVQESLARQTNPTPLDFRIYSKSSKSFADSLFIEGIKSRIQYWRKTCLASDESPHGKTSNSLKMLILGTQTYGKRPCMTIDVCSEHQVNLVFQTIHGISDSLVPLRVHDKGVIARSVQVVLTSSEEDKSALLSDIQRAEEEQNFKLRGFREVIDLISSSQKPIVSYNCLNDFTFIHEKFIAPLPPSMHEFACSLKMVFPEILDLGHLMKEIGPLKNAKNVSSAFSYLNRQLFLPIKLEVPFQGDKDAEKKNQGRNVLKITSLFAQISQLLKFNPIEGHTNIFHPISRMELDAVSHQDDTINHATKQEEIAKWSTHNLVFIWGFNSTSSSNLKNQLKSYHPKFNEDFNLKIVDRNCAVAAFKRQGAVVELLKEVEAGSSSIENMLSDGVRIAGFGAYKKICEIGLWDGELADSLQTVMLSEHNKMHVSVENNTSEIYWDSKFMLDPNEYLEI
ncbi:poly(A)-specific ribonuclease PARN-like protein [Carex littledalei]|uniref:Poly(A)-specific ribonuclease PARN-like protein n=1 Tax=Carex littledalei TaxID=544730 RepID=A0A833QXF9_9POAL|nr:poly(A)-specific ribonuclease PARN-like protein [Carex littledalei]